MANIYQKGNQVWLNAGGEWFWYDQSVEPLGRGAMGTVYIGYAHPSGMRVAIKRVTDRFANVPSIRQRARQEAEMQFRHPNLVEMLGYCEWQPQSGPIFIISRLVYGDTIDKFIEKTGIRDRATGANHILEMAFPVMDALEYLHNRGILHLDIKPSNIMVENGRNVCLMDLGIAYAGAAFDLSSAGLLGTPGYAAPEQYIEPGKSVDNLDCATDVYELGATIYELLSGEKSDFSKSATVPEIRGVSRPVMEVIRKSLNPDKEERWQSVGDFRNALRRAMTMPVPRPNRLKIVIISVVALISAVALALLIVSNL